MKRRFWTKKEVEKLKKLYGRTSNKKLAKIFNRTPNAVQSKAAKIGIELKGKRTIFRYSNKYWTKEEDEYVKKYYGKIAAWKMGDYMKRTVSSIHHRANRLRISGYRKKKNKTLRRGNYYLWVQITKKVFNRDGYKCIICGYSKHLSCHHILAVKKGGTDKENNLITLCPNCHAEADAGEISKHKLTQLTTS